MKKLSRWGKNNPGKARIIIACAHFLLVAEAIFLGLLSYLSDIALPNWLLIALCNLFFIAYFLYPNKRDKKGLFKHSFQKQKTIDFILSATYALAIVVGLNQFSFAPLNRQTPATGRGLLIALNSNPRLHEADQTPDKSLIAGLKSKIKNSRAQLKVELKAWKEANKAQGDTNDDGVAKVLLILLALAGFLVLLVLITWLSCSVACSGQEGLGWMIAILGTAGAIWLLVIAIKAILRKGRKQNRGTVETS